MAYHLGHHIMLEEAARAYVDRVVEKTKSDLSLKLGEGNVFLFAFGSCVFVGVEQQQIDVFLADVLTYVKTKSDIMTDDFRIEVQEDSREKVQFDHVVVQRLSQQRLRLICQVVAQSATLEYYEKLVEGLLDRASAFTDGLAKSGRTGGSVREMLRFIGVGLSTRREIVSSLAILDAPDVAWDDPQLDSLFSEMRSNFELAGRYRTLEHKLSLIHESMEVLVDLSHSRQSTHLELLVVVLIAVEVVMALFGGH